MRKATRWKESALSPATLQLQTTWWTLYPRWMLSEYSHKKHHRCNILWVSSLRFQRENPGYSWDWENREQSQALEWIPRVNFPEGEMPQSQRTWSTVPASIRNTNHPAQPSGSRAAPAVPLTSWGLSIRMQQGLALPGGFYCKTNEWTHVRGKDLKMYLALQEIFFYILDIILKLSLWSKDRRHRNRYCNWWLVLSVISVRLPEMKDRHNYEQYHSVGWRPGLRKSCLTPLLLWLSTRTDSIFKLWNKISLSSLKLLSSGILLSR